MPAQGLKCIILDAEAISDFDSTAAEALENLDADLERRTLNCGSHGRIGRYVTLCRRQG